MVDEASLEVDLMSGLPADEDAWDAVADPLDEIDARVR